ncbi:MAG: DNA-3-methyladenine glycosylase [Patescibacteria group bacterium]
MARKLPRSFYARPTLTVARDLLGKRLVRRYRGRRLSGVIVETEAYMGPEDVASHARHGEASKAAPMFGEPGHAYIYFTYGMHYCMNCVTEPKGSGTGVLVRASEPVEGIAAMRRNRRRRSVHLKALPDHGLTNGPAKLCQALGLDKRLNREDLLGDTLWVENAPDIPSRKVGKSSRVGIRRGREHHWRFYLEDSPFVSAHPRY